ncbi:MAG: AsmA family protein, partial [Myxococcaceae bacterium]
MWRRRGRGKQDGTAEPKRKRPLGRRILRGTLWGLGGFVALVLLLVLAVVGYALTDSGNKRIKNFAVDKVNHTIRGELAVGKLVFRGNHLVLEDVALNDPDGEPVAHIERAEVRLNLSALLHKTLDVTSLDVERPQLLVVKDADGTNVQRAIELIQPKEQTPKQQNQKKSSFSVKVE